VDLNPEPPGIFCKANDRGIGGIGFNNLNHEAITPGVDARMIFSHEKKYPPVYFDSSPYSLFVTEEQS